MKKKQYTTVILYLILSIGAFFSIYPIYFMFVAATKSSGEIFMNTPPIFFGNYFFKNFFINSWFIKKFNKIFYSLFKDKPFLLSNISISTTEETPYI